MKIKKTIIAVLLSSMMLTFSACGGSSESSGDVTASPAEATTENIYDLNYNLQIDDYVSCRVNWDWELKSKDDRIYVFSIPGGEKVTLAKAKDSDVVTDASLIDYLKAQNQDFSLINVGGRSTVLVASDTEDKYYLNVNGNSYVFILSNGIPEDAKSAILDSINIVIERNSEKATKEITAESTEKAAEKPAEKPTEEKPTEKITEKATEAPTEKPTDTPKEYQNALKKAKVYSDTMYMSKSGIYNQLTSEYGEGFSEDAADYAIENLDADYKANALAKAKTYQETMAMSKSAIYDQLVSEYGEGFTEEEAQYAIDNLED